MNPTDRIVFWRCTALSLLVLTSCALTNHPVQKASLGAAQSLGAVEALIDQPGPVTVETINSSDWSVDKAGVVNLDREAAKAAGLKNGPEPISVYFHVIRHPTFGTFIVDTGLEVALRDDPSKSALQGMVASFLKFDPKQVKLPLGEWLRLNAVDLKGVFFTHLHLDHVLGLPDVPKGTPLFAGPGETGARSVTNLMTRGTYSTFFSGHAPLQEWAFGTPAVEGVASAIDIFQDGSVWALWTPGHTPGSTSYLVRTPTGPVLLTGDTSHTAWGWKNAVEPGEFTADHARNLSSLLALKKLSERHPSLAVRLGHQPLDQ